MATDLVASTGVNDASSPWGGLLQTAVDFGTNYLEQALGLQTPVPQNNGAPKVTAPAPAAPAAAAAAPASGFTHYLPWIIGAAVVGLVVWLVYRD